MSLFAKTLEQLILEYVGGTQFTESTLRLLVPAPTRDIGRDLQTQLCVSLPPEIPVYLVVDPTFDGPNEQSKWLVAEAATSKREGSFIMVVQPGTFSRLHESVVRAANVSFGDEWPWSPKNENPIFSFKHSVLPKLIEDGNWANKQSDRDNLKDLIATHILPKLIDSHEKNELFFDDIIDGYDVSCDNQKNDRIQHFLFHVGIPKIENQESWNDLDKVCSEIYSNMTLRQRAEVIESLEDQEDESLVNAIYDGVGSGGIDGSGILSLRKPMKSLDKDAWKILTAEKLKKLFNIKQKRVYELRAEFSTIDNNSKALYISPYNDYLIAKEHVGFGIRCIWNLGNSSDPIAKDSYEIQIRINKKVLKIHQLDTAITTEGEDFYFNISDEELFGKSNNGKPKKITVCLIDTGKILIKKTLTIQMLDTEFSEVVIIDDPPKVNVFSYKPDENEEDIESIESDEPFRVTILSIDDLKDVVLKANDEPLSLVKEPDSSIAKINVDLLDVTAYHDGKARITAEFPNSNEIMVELRSAGKAKGYFSIEELLLVNLMKSRAEVKAVYKLFSGASVDPSSLLGGLNDSNHFRVSLAHKMEMENGERPVIVSIRDKAGPELNDLPHVRLDSSLNLHEGQFVIGQIGKASDLRKAYREKRYALLQFYNKHLGTQGIMSRHPLYARVPTYIDTKKSEIEDLIGEYLEVYRDILKLLASKTLSRGDEFILTYLDCVVAFDNKPSGNDFESHELFLIAPWHPLQLADRFQRQRTKFYSAQYCNDHEDTDIFKAAGVLDDLAGLRSIHALSGHNSFVNSYVSDTSDLGWSVALKVTKRELDFNEYSPAIKGLFDLNISATPAPSASLYENNIRNFLAANPSERRLEIYIRNGLNSSQILLAVAAVLYNENSGYGRQLSGGVHLYFQNLGNEELEEIDWQQPPICVYRAPDEEQCLKDNHIDILIVAPDKGVVIQNVDVNSFRKIPRGRGPNGGMTLTLPALKEGAGTSKSIYQETTYLKTDCQDNIVDKSLCISQIILEIIDGKIGIQIQRSVTLPKVIAASWVILPGNVTNPAMLSHYVNANIQGENQKVLWEYDVDLTSNRSDYYILSETSAGLAMPSHNQSSKILIPIKLSQTSAEWG